MSDLYTLCKEAVGHHIYYVGTNGDERSQNFGQAVQGIAYCLECHDSHGLCIIIRTGFGDLCVDPEEIIILPNVSGQTAGLVYNVFSPADYLEICQKRLLLGENYGRRTRPIRQCGQIRD